MKTGMEWPLVGMVVMLALIVIWNTWSGMQVDLAVARLEATAAGQVVPEAALIGGEWITKAVIGTLIGGMVTAGITAGMVWARREWRKAQGQKRWKSGPNAKWGQQPSQPREMSEAQFYRMMLARQMGGQTRTNTPNGMEAEDEPTINF
jgi:hypothetical protein